MESIFKDNYEKIMVIDCFKKYGQGDAFYPNVKILESPEEYKNFVNEEKPYMKVGFEVVGCRVQLYFINLYVFYSMV